MRTTMCLPCCLLLACVWPSQAQQTTFKDKALIDEKSASQKEPGTQTGDRVSTQNTPKPTEGAQTGNPADSFFVAMENGAWEALQKKDKSAATRLLADDFVGMYDFGFFSKSEWIKQIDDQYTVDDYTIENAKLLRPSANTALLLYTSNCKGTGTWAEFCSHTSRVSDLFVERNGQWVALFSQDTQATSSQTLPGQKEIENQIIALEKRMWNGDANEVSKLEGEDYEAIKHAHLYHRADDEAAAKDVKFVLTSMDDIRVRMLRPDVALITYHATQKGSFRGTEVPPSLYFGSIWVTRSGRWKNVFLEENAPDVFTDIYKPSTDQAQPQTQSSEIAQSRSLDDDLSAQALAKEREILEAQNRNDWTAFASLLADDLVAIDEDGIHGKKELLEEVRAAEVRFSDYKMESVKVIPQNNGAIVAYKETLVGTEHGKPFTWHIYTHSHWERRGGKWLMTMFQDSTAKD